MASGVMDRARRILRQWSPPSWWTAQGPYTSVIVHDSDVAGNWWAMPVTARTALAVGAVYRALAIYADDISTLPVQRLRGTDELAAPPFVARPAGAVVGWTDELGQVLWSLLLRGNAYCLVTSVDWTGYPETFYVLNPDTVTVEPAPTGGIRYRYHPGGDAPERLFDNPGVTELLHIRWQRPPGSVVGFGVLDAQCGPGSTLAAAYAGQTYAADSVANPIPPAVLTHPLRLNKAQAEDLQGQWASSLGRGRAVPAVLSGGVTFQPLTVTPRDVQLIESQRWNATAIAVMFGLPPYMLGGSVGDSLTYSTVEGENTRLWVNTLQPMCVRLQRAFDAWLPAGQRLRFNPDALLRSQTLDRYNAHRIALDPAAPFMTVDEVRELENRAPIGAPPPPALPAPQPIDAPPPMLEVVQ